MLSAYPNKVVPMINAVKTGTGVNIDQWLANESRGSDRILYTMERGRVGHIIGDTGLSMRELKTSIETVFQNDLRAVVSGSRILEHAGSVLTNDNIISYQGEGYERVLLHHYQALNYLRKKDIEGAGVEARRANSEQDESLQKYEGELESARETAEEKKVGSTCRSVVAEQYARLDEVAGRVKNSFQNAYTYYLSGFIYELLNQPNDAYIDYKRALEIFPENRYVQKDVIRLSSALNMGEELDDLKARFGVHPPNNAASDESAGELLVFFEDGFAPRKKEIKIPVPVMNAGIVAIAFPIYDERWSAPRPAHIYADNSYAGATEPLCDIRTLAVKALKEKAPLIAIRQLIRAAAKGAANNEAKKKLGDLGMLGMTIMNMATENADLRSWLTLPANAQLLRVPLPSGMHKMSVQSDEGASVFTDVDIPPKGKTLLQVVKAGARFYLSSTSFR
jgi:hypothetical protein